MLILRALLFYSISMTLMIAPGPPIRLLPELDSSNTFFWTSGKDGLLSFLRCEKCRHYVHPMTPICPYCLCDKVVPEPVSGRGILHSFTLNHQQWIPGSDPYVIGLVTIAEQDDIRLTTNIVVASVDDLEIGMEMKVEFDHVEDVWIPVFRPAQSNTGQIKDRASK